MTKKPIEKKVNKIFALGMPPDPSQSIDSIQRLTNDWIPFGSDNLFPQAIANINRKSPVNRGIINSKVIYTIGKKFLTEDKKTENFIKSVNNKGESLRKVTKKLILDKYSFGNAFLEIIRGKGFTSWFHHDETTGRVHRDGDKIIFHPDWEHWSSLKEKFTTLPLYPVFKRIDGFERSVIHYKDYEPTFTYNGVPDWIAGLKISVIGHKTDKWNLSRLDTDLKTPGVLIVESDIENVEDGKKLKELVKKEFAGEDGGGFMCVIKSPGSENNTKWIPMEQKNDGNWQKLHEQSTSDMIIAHNWYRSLTSLPDNTGFDTKRIRTEYEVAMATVINDVQAEFLEVFNGLLLDAGYKDDLTILNQPPVSYIDEIDLNYVIKKGEARKLIGLEVDESDPEMLEVIKKNIRDGSTGNTSGDNK